ncbi:MAG: hybrid sensor histidine kinase/response regulator [Leptospiraceae bacterium]|nr:hybrid sensor histidine kinase/response regulator [Leptospiraceae bacterium]
MEDKAFNKILIIDDVEDNVIFASSLLSKQHYEVHSCLNGKDALEKIEKVLFDLILLDINMPGMDGLSVCRKIKENESCRDIPIIFLTAMAEPEFIESAFDSGGVDYIRKPFYPKELLARVKTHIEIRKQKYLLQQHQDELQRLNHSKDKFFSIIAHDLKAPFNSIISYGRRLENQMKYCDNESCKSYIESINKSSKTTFQLLENLLIWARTQTGRIQFEITNLNLLPVMIDSLSMAKMQADVKEIILEYNIPKECRVLVDKNSIWTVIRNLLSNAIKFTPRGGRIYVDLSSKEKEATLLIRDTGIGISKDDINKLFKIDSSFSKRGTEEETGSGLGLILCKEFTEKNGGKIFVNSTEGEGSSFTVVLPLSQ